MLEALIALALTGVVFAILTSGVWFTGRALESSDTKIEEIESLLHSYRLLRQAVGRAYPLPSDDGRGDELLFEGTEHRLRLTALLPPYAQVAGVHDVEFRIEVDSGGTTELWLSQALHRPDHGAAGPAAGNNDKFLLYRGGRKLAFGYYGGSEQSSKTANWQSAWSDRRRLPKLVRLAALAGDERGGGWPELVLPVRSAPLVPCIQLPALPFCDQEPAQ